MISFPNVIPTFIFADFLWPKRVYTKEEQPLLFTAHATIEIRD